MVNYMDSEVKVFHPLCQQALVNALKALGMDRDYTVLHHQYTGTLEMDYVIQNIHTKKYFCVVEIKRTPADVQSTRYQFQALSYVQMNEPENETTFYILTNLEKLISFRYDPLKPRVFQQILMPGLESICDFAVDDEIAITDKLASVFTRLIDAFKNNRYTYLTTLEQFLTYMSAIMADDKKWKSSMAIFMYEYIRGAFNSVKRTDIRYDVRKFHDDVEQICIEANRVDFDGIFSYDKTKYVPKISMSPSILADIYKYGNVNISGDSIADALHSMISDNQHHNGEVATDLELASLAAVLAKISHGPLGSGRKISDPAAGSGNLICSAIRVFHAEPNQLQANDINPKLIELLSLRLGLSFPKIIGKPNVAQITTADVVTLNKTEFCEVDVVLLNPPFVAGINCVNRKTPFFDKIKKLTGVEAMTKVGQMNLGAVFLETICRLVNPGTTIVCIFPKAHLTERGVEAVTFRRLLLNLFGLHTIFNYPSEDLFDSVIEETCIFVGRVEQRAKKILVYSSDEKVSDIDLHSLENITSGFSATDFTTVFPGVEAKIFDMTDLDKAAKDGWRMVCSEMLESIKYIERNIVKNPKLDRLPNTTNTYRKGNVGVDGGSDLLFFSSLQDLYSKYYGSVILEEGMRNAKCEHFVLNKGDSLFLNFNGIAPPLSKQIINDYILLSRTAGKQQRKAKSMTEWEIIAKKAGKVHFKENSILVPTKIRRNGRVHLSKIPLYVSTNFAVFTYSTILEAEIISSYMTTIFYQLECEVTSKAHAGVRKLEIQDVVTTHVPKICTINAYEIAKIQAEIPGVTYLDLNNPIVSNMDMIWAEILFGSRAKEFVEDAQRLLKFLANRRNR